MEKVQKIVLTRADRDLFLKALEDFGNNGLNKVECDICHAAIRFQKSGSATRHECDCGKFNGVLRGL
jgi:hypothetical protein